MTEGIIMLVIGSDHGGFLLKQEIKNIWKKKESTL